MPWRVVRPALYRCVIRASCDWHATGEQAEDYARENQGIHTSIGARSRAASCKSVQNNGRRLFSRTVLTTYAGARIGFCV